MRAVLLAALLAVATPLLRAQGKGGVGDLMVMPTRVVLEGRDRSAEVTLRNSGRESCTYRVFFQEMRMQPSGQVEIVPRQDGVLTAADLVRFTPRQVTLLPGEYQTVRVQLRKPEDLKDGEYRSHLVFQGIPPAEPPKPLVGEDEKVLSFDIKTVVSLSIPVIVRHGQTEVAVAIRRLDFRPAADGALPALDVELLRKGNRGVQGEIKVDWLPASGRARTLVPVLGAVIYPELDSRTFHMDLGEAKGLDLRHGRLKVTFTYKDAKLPPVVAFQDLS
jgi:P pilus assembly chaperone PapD